MQISQKQLLGLVRHWCAKLSSPHLFNLVSLALGVVVLGSVTYSYAASHHKAKVVHHPVVIKKVTRTVKAPAPAPTPKPAPAPASTAPAATPKPASAPVSIAPKPKPAAVVPSPSSSVSGLTPNSSPPSSGSQANNSSPSVTSYSSTNWSGYMSTSGSFTAVSASWIATSPTGNGSTTTADATWIGIGGVTSGDLIQVGTQNIVTSSGQVEPGAFYEMLPAVSQTIPNFVVHPGDSITASVTETSTNQWSISITDNTDSQSFSTSVSYSSSLSSAEWIEEDPSYGNGSQIPFDNFGSTSFSGGLTKVNGLSSTIGASGPASITMVNGSGQPIAVPSGLSGDGAGFSVSFR